MVDASEVHASLVAEHAFSRQHVRAHSGYLPRGAGLRVGEPLVRGLAGRRPGTGRDQPRVHEFLDGFGRNEEGFIYLNYLQYGRARSINGNNGRPLPYFNDPKIDAFVLVNQVVYVLPEKLFDDSAHLGIDFILPVVAFDTSFAPAPPAPGVQLKDNGIGVGDLTFGPLIQFRPIVVDSRPVFSTRVEFDVIAPIGSYDPEKDINQGPTSRH